MKFPHHRPPLWPLEKAFFAVFPGKGLFLGVGPLACSLLLPSLMGYIDARVIVCGGRLIPISSVGE